MSKRTLNISNYEEWMIDHLDGVLSKEEEALLNSFLNEHPELDVDIESISFMVLSPSEFTHPEKESLKRRDSDDVIIQAIESGMGLTELLSKHPDTDKGAFTFYEKTILRADTNLVFPDKESLKRDKTLIIPLWVQRVAIAATIAGIGLFLFSGPDEESYVPRESVAEFQSFDLDPLSDSSTDRFAEEKPTPEMELKSIIEEVLPIASMRDIDNSNGMAILVNEDSPKDEPHLNAIRKELELIEQLPIYVVEVERSDFLPELMSVEDVLLSDVPLPELEIAQVPTEPSDEGFTTFLDLVKKASKDSELLAINDLNKDDPYVETSVRVGAFELSVKRKRRRR